MKYNIYEYVQAFISNISFPTDIEGLRYFVYEHGKYNVENILDGYGEDQCWTVPRHSKVGDVVLFLHAITARQRIVMLRNIIKKDISNYDDAPVLLEWLQRALELYDVCGGKIFAIGQITTIPTSGEFDAFEGQHWGNTVYADVSNIVILKNMIHYHEFKDIIKLSQQSGITRLPGEEFKRIRERINVRNVNLPEYYLNCQIGDFSLSNITVDNYFTATKEYRRRFLLEIDFRSYFVDYLLKNLSGKNYYRECKCYNKEKPLTFVDNVFSLNGRYYLLEVKLNIRLEKDLCSQLNQYMFCEYIDLEKKELNHITDFEREFMCVIDTEAIYIYIPNTRKIEEIIKFDNATSSDSIIDLLKAQIRDKLSYAQSLQ